MTRVVVLAEAAEDLDEAKRNRVYCAQSLLDILEEPAHLTPADPL